MRNRGWAGLWRFLVAGRGRDLAIGAWNYGRSITGLTSAAASGNGNMNMSLHDANS